MSAPGLDALLADVPPPPVPAGLAARVLAAAATTPQEARLGQARRTARDRRGRWLRRPLLAGTAALGLLVTSAVAATLAGVPIPQKIAAVFFPAAAEKAAPKAAPIPHRAVRPAPVRPVRAETAAAAPPPPGPLPPPGPERRLLVVQHIVEARRAMGLPTPGAARIERRLERRAIMWAQATPEQRALWLERRRERQAARLAGEPVGRVGPPPPRWLRPGQSRAVLSPEERAARRAETQAWRARVQAGVSMTDEERAARQARIREWQALRRARLRGQDGPPLR